MCVKWRVYAGVSPLIDALGSDIPVAKREREREMSFEKSRVEDRYDERMKVLSHNIFFFRLAL